MPDIKLSDMTPGTIYYGVVGGLKGVFKLQKFFTTHEEAVMFREEVKDRKIKELKMGPFIRTARVMVEEVNEDESIRGI